jgi:hypothetical protein
MADRVRKVSYCYTVVSRRAGQGAKILSEIKEAGIDLLGFSGFPGAAGKAQLVFVAASIAPLRRLARKNGWRLSAPRKGFLVDGPDEVGALHRHVERLAAAKISITAADAVSAGKGRFGMLLWVKAKDYARAAKALRAK